MIRAKTPGAGPAGNIEEELKDLRKRFHLLEGDRAAFYETSQWTIKQNKDAHAALKQQNKELRAQVATLQSAHSSASGDRLGVELERAMQLVQSLRKDCDERKHNTRAKEQQLQKLQDQLRELSSDGSTRDADGSPVAMQIRTLENKLDKAMIKYNEAQSIRKTYEQIVQRLQEERVNFDNQITALERTLKAREHDYEELQLMSHDARHAKQVAQLEMQKLQADLAETQALREHVLAEQQAILAAAQSAREEKERSAAERATPVPAEDARPAVQPTAIDEQVEQQQKKISTHEEAFRKIKEATGVADINEVITKFLTQEETYQNLLMLQQEAQNRIDALQTEKKSIKARMDDLKYSGTGAGGNRRVVDDFEQYLADETSKMERNRVKYERLAKILVNVKAGIEHLYDKLEIIKTDEAPLQMTDETVVEVLLQCENKLAAVMGHVGDDVEGSPRKPLTARSSELPQYNVRIRLPEDGATPAASPAPPGMPSPAPPAADDDEDDGSEGEGLDVMDRSEMKRRSEAAMERSARKKKPAKAAKARATTPEA